MTQLAIIVGLLCATVLVMFFVSRRDNAKYVWFVSTTGELSSGKDIQKLFGPFQTQRAAKDFRNKWEHRFVGFAVMDRKLKEEIQ